MHNKVMSQSPGGVTVLYGPKPYPGLADRAGKRLDDSSHEALHLQEVKSANTGRPINQENNICCLHIITPACKYKRWRIHVSVWRHNFLYINWHRNTRGELLGLMWKLGGESELFIPWASARFMEDRRTVTVKTQLHIFTTWAHKGQTNLFIMVETIKSHYITVWSNYKIVILSWF